MNQSRLKSYTRDVIVHLLLLLVPIVAVILVAAPYVLGIFGQRYAAEATDLLRLLALSSVPCMITAVYVASARVRRRIATVATLQVVTSVLVLGASYVALGRLGISGVGVAWLGCQTLVASVVVLLMLRQSRAVSNAPRVWEGARQW